jgi:hypothetical protein
VGAGRLLGQQVGGAVGHGVVPDVGGGGCSGGGCSGAPAPRV